MVRFFANVVTVQEIPECESFAIGLAESVDGEGHSLELQITLEDDPSQAELNYYCLVTETQATHYGGIASCKLSPSSLRLDLTDLACNELEIQDGYEVDFQLTEAKMAELRVGLQRILDRGPEKLKTIEVD